MSMMDGELTPSMPEPPVANPAMGPMPQEIKRDVEAPQDPARAALVKELLDWCAKTKRDRSKTFDKMRRDMAFVRPGNQWKGRSNTATDDNPYEVNITQRHIQQRVAALYAKNPKVVARRRQRLDFELWDGDQQTLQSALQRAVGKPPTPGTPANPETGQGATPGDPGIPPAPTPEDMALFADIERGMQMRKMLDRVAKTLEILYRYYMNEGTPTFKTQAKQLVRRAQTTGVGWLQLGFQRVMQLDPTIQNRIRDDTERIKYLQTLAADAADDKLAEYQHEITELELGMAGLQMDKQIVVREGLVFEFPSSTSILVDMDCVQLKGLVNAKRVAREFHYTKRQVKEIFGVDIGTNYTQYSPTKTWERVADNNRDRETNVACVYCVWDANTGLCYYVCEGFPNFLMEPAPPTIKVERFFPLYCLSFNDLEDEHNIYPPSDVEVVRPMQLEMNRSREGIREHRIGNKPGYVSSKGVFDDTTKTRLSGHSPNELIETNLPPDKKIADMLMAKPTVAIDPAVYAVDGVLQDFLLVSNSQQANLGPTSDSTATEASIAETSRLSSLQSNIDDMNDFLTEVARDAGQILMLEMSPEQVVKIAGPGAVWPEMSREELAEEIYLEIEAGSSGRPNKALEIANMERMAPYLIQMKGIKQQWLATEMLKRIDDNIDLADAFDIQMPSVVAQNTIDGAMGKQMQPGTGDPATDPSAQGAAGEQGAAGPAPPRPTGPRPKPPVPGEASIH